MDKMTPDRLRDRFKSSLANLKPQLSLAGINRRDSGSSLAAAAAEVTFSPEEMRLPAILKEDPQSPLAAAAAPVTDPLVDDEILEEMEKVYYGEHFDPIEHELLKLPPTLDLQVLQGDRVRLQRQEAVVSKRVFAQIASRQSACRAQMDRAAEIGQEVTSALSACVAGRRGLAKARREFTGSSLGILAAFRRRQQIVRLLHDLDIVRTLQKTDERLQELLAEDEDFPGAIQLLLECQKVAVNYGHFAAVRQLSAKLQDTLDMTEEKLDVALSKVCVDFNSRLYSRLHTAYRLLGKTHTSMDQLHMHLTSSIHITAWNVVYGHAMLSQSDRPDVDLSKKPYPDLCECMESSSILPCLVDLCRALWNIMNSYRQIVEWHERESMGETEDHELTLERQYVSKKLDTGKMRIWQDVQSKTKVFVVANDLSGFTIDTFLEFMDVIHKLIEVGHAFCGGGSPSDTLQESLQMQCWNYFHIYHLARLDELKMHLENEGWALCPVKPTFKVQQLTEFRHLASPAKRPSTTDSPRKFVSKQSSVEVSPFDNVYDDISFLEEDVLMPPKTSEGFYSDGDDDDSDDDISEELRKEFVDERTGEEQQQLRKTSFRGSRRRRSSNTLEQPTLTNTSLMLLRLWGKYLHLMRALRPIAHNVFTSMAQLIEYYVMIVHVFFTHNLPSESRSQVTSPALTKLLRRIEEDLIRRKQRNNGFSSVSSSHSLSSSASSQSFAAEGQQQQSPQSSSGLVDLPSLPSPSLDNHPETLFGLPERFAAVESALYLVQQFRALKPTLKSCLPKDKQDVVDDYDKETLSVLLPDLRYPVYMTVAMQSIKPDIILQLMSKVCWDIKDVSSKHSQYVEVLLRDFQLFSMNLQDVRKSLHIPLDVRTVLWDLCTRCASNIFVEGFSCAKKCNNGGRALMQLDFRHFAVVLEKMSEGSRPLLYQDYVANYVKAYYIPELDLEAWVKLHSSEYTAKQLEALINCVGGSGKTKKSLNSLINDLSGKIRKNNNV